MAMSKTHLDHMDTWKQWKQTGDQEAKKTLVEHYLPLVQHVSLRMSQGLPSNISQEDLYSYGTIGLIDAIDKFDLNRGIQFETYASWRIKGAILDSLRQGDWVPRSVREKSRKVEEAYQELEQKFLRSVSEHEVSSYLQMDTKELRKIRQEISMTTLSSLEDSVQDEEVETTLLSKLSDDKVRQPEETVHDHYLKETITRAIKQLTDREKTVVSLFYYEDLSLSEIAEVMSLTPSRISQLHSKAIWRLKSYLDKEKEWLQQR